MDSLKLTEVSTFNELMETILEFCPTAAIGEDNDGQLLIYTGYQVITPEENPSVPLGEIVVTAMPEG